MLDQIKSLVKDKGIEYLFCSFVELSGAPKAKLVPATHLDDMAREGAGFAETSACAAEQRLSAADAEIHRQAATAASGPTL